MAKNEIDWEALERDYRCGVKTLKVIGAEYGISDAGIIKRAKRDGWARDLSGKIKAMADAKVSADAVSESVSESEKTNRKVSEKQIVEANAEMQVRIRREQRTDIQRMRQLVVGFLADLEDDLLVKDEKKKLTLQLRVQIMQKVVDTHKTVVSMEREHFGITSRFGDDEDTPLQQYDTVETARRIAFVLASALNKGA